jgi:hypothetical protein
MGKALNADQAGGRVPPKLLLETISFSIFLRTDHDAGRVPDRLFPYDACTDKYGNQ